LALEEFAQHGEIELGAAQVDGVSAFSFLLMRWTRFSNDLPPASMLI